MSVYYVANTLAWAGIIYGFILRYPQGKEENIGYSYEPWHFRFLGVPIAVFMHE